MGLTRNNYWRFPAPDRRRAASWLAIGIFGFIILLSWYGYRAVVEWRRTSELLARRRSQEGADLLVEALIRDMRGVQETVLTSLEWQRFAIDRPYEMSNLVASTFARYPYPESLFAWRAGSPPAQVVFFNRSDRRPPWMPLTGEESRFPVIVEQHPAIGALILDRVQKDARRGRRLSAFHILLEGIPYQVVARLNYRDAFREQLLEVIGFTVNLPWVRAQYFRDLTRQVWDIGGFVDEGLEFAILDDAGKLVAGSAVREDDPLTNTRAFDVAFFNPDLVLDPLSDVPAATWQVRISAATDRGLSQAIGGANRTLLMGAASALALAIGLALTARAERANARLAEMRSDFVSTVTHELKTPVATIRAAAETWSHSRLSGADTFQSYGKLVVEEAKRLTRLIDNLLAYARITDIAEVYTFGPLPVGALFKDIQQEFEAQLDESGFDLQITIAPEVRAVRGDRLALRLLFNNLIDNAIRYSRDERRVQLTAQTEAAQVVIRVIDWGVGIPPEEIPLVTRRFVRGSRARSGGSGLGLAIATRIARDHGGSLTIESELGRGTTVTVRLPAV